jgi:hypothetical protein
MGGLMINFSKILEFGPTVILAAVILVIAVGAYKGFDFFKKRYRSSEAGERRQMPLVVHCPNDVPALAGALTEISRALTDMHQDNIAQRKMNHETMRVLERMAVGVEHLEDKYENIHGDAITKAIDRIEQTGVGIDRLVFQHQPAPNGTETWKGSAKDLARAEKFREKSYDTLVKMSTGQEAMQKTLDAMLTVAKTNGRK